MMNQALGGSTSVRRCASLEGGWTHLGSAEFLKKHVALFSCQLGEEFLITNPTEPIHQYNTSYCLRIDWHSQIRRKYYLLAQTWTGSQQAL